MTIRELIKELQKGDDRKDVSVETTNDNGESFYTSNIYVSFDDRGHAVIYPIAEENI